MADALHDRGPAANDGAGQVGGPEATVARPSDTGPPDTLAAYKGALLRRTGQRLDRAGRALLTGDLDADGVADLAGDALRDLVRGLVRGAP